MRSLFSQHSSYYKRRILATAVAGLSLYGLSSVGAFAATEPSYEELQQTVQELKERVQTLESAKPVSAAAVDDTVERVIRDAQERSQLLAADGLTAGYDKGFFIRSADGNFSLKPGIQWQFRSVSTFRSEGQADGDDDTQNGFENRRLRFRFDGNAFSQDLTYTFQFDTNRSGGGVSLLDAFVQYKFAPTWAVKVGQFKESAFHERDISGFSQLAVDRSIVDAYLGGALTDRVQGIALVYGSKDEPLRLEFTYHDGANSRNTDFREGPTNFGFGGRAEYKFGGDWASYRDFTAKGTKETLFVVGAGADFTQGGDVNALATTIDVHWENDAGLGIYAALHGNFIDSGFLEDGDRFDWGGLAQAGYLFNPNWEIFGRYDVVLFDDDFAGDSENVFNELTAGVNYYFGPDGSYLHRAKVTVDVVYLPDGAPSDQTGLGILASDEEQFVLRAQFQLIL